MSFVGKGAEQLCRRDALVREPAVPGTEVLRREVVVSAGGAKRVLGRLERRAPRADQLVEVDKIHRHTPIVALGSACGDRRPADSRPPGATALDIGEGRARLR